jgi:hypothetical protein
MDAEAEDADPVLAEMMRQITSLELANGALSAEAAEQERELRDVKAEVHVRDEYIAKLEAELEDRRVRIAAMPSVRIKKWLISVLQGSLGRGISHRIVRRIRPTKDVPA